MGSADILATIMHVEVGHVSMGKKGFIISAVVNAWMRWAGGSRW